MVSGFLVPRSGLYIVLLYAKAVSVKPADAGLRVRITLIGSLLKPGHGLRIVLFDTKADRVPSGGVAGREQAAHEARPK